MFDRIRKEEKLLKSEGIRMGHNIIMKDVKNIQIDPNSVNQYYFGNVAIGRCISYLRGLHFTACLEFLHMPIINKYDVMNVCGNKLLTTLFLKKYNISTPKTYFTFSHDSAISNIEKIGYPLVIKPIIGSWGRGIALLKDKDSAEAILEIREINNGPFDRLYYFQEFIKRPPRDIRVIMVGERILAAMYRKSSDNFKTNIACGALPIVCDITKDIEEICMKISMSMKNSILGIDIMEDEKDGLVVHEINSTVEFSGLMQVTKTNIPREIIQFALDFARK